MDDAALTAYCSMVAAIAQHARLKAVHDRKYFLQYYSELDQDDVVYSSDFMSTFENAADALTRLNIMKPLDRLFSIFTCEPWEEYVLSKLNWPNGLSFSDLFEAFIDLFGEFGTEYWGFSTSPDTPFKPKGKILASAMNDLLAIGYAETIDDGFLWTGKARSAMVAMGFWLECADDGGA